jgi:hypothetical protein
MTDESRDGTGKFLPGTSGNPGGRPKGPSLTTYLRKHLADPANEKIRDTFRKQGFDVSDEATNGEVLALIMVQRAMMGDSRMITQVLDRVEGKAKGTLEVSGKVDGEVKHTHSGDAAFQLLAARVADLREKAAAQLPAGDVVDAEVVEK